MGERNEGGERILDFALSFDLAICNTFLKKANSQYVTYKSGGRESQIDFLMGRRRDLKEVRNCKVLYGEHLSAQHKIVVTDWEFRAVKKKRPQRGAPRIKWWRLKDDNLKSEFKERVLGRIEPLEEVQD